MTFSILHLTAPGAFGGLESVLEGLATITAARGHRVVICAVLDEGSPVPEWLNRLSRLGVDIVPVFLPPRAYLTERRIVKALMIRSRVDVVHTHGYRADVMHSGTASRLGIAQVSTAHGFASTGLKGKFFEWLQLRAWRKARAVIAVSRPLVETLVRSGVSRDRIDCIPNAVVTAARPVLDRTAARHALGLGTTGTVVGWVGRFSPEKAPDVMLRALARCRDHSIQLCMIGDGSMMPECQRLCAELGLNDRVRFAGFRPDAASCFAALDVLALSSHTEGTPMVLLEAAVARVPIVATSVGGVPDLIGHSGGWLVEPAAADALAAALDEATASPSERSLRATNAKARIEASSGSEQWLQRHLELYKRILGGTTR